VVTALYRRYRPESFAELIGQSQVTAPLMAALRSDRVNHAYLFSGPRGCGKTTSARILARCLNCAEGPTDTPCGVCPSCVELSRDGSGSLDVVEIDAASHNGVDDARELRERAIFAPVRDRYKIFILDEAHMVTAQGFNALLKIVEEPPAHVKFIFATTEPEKVIGTIRSRTHHYPFRLVPPAQLLEYMEQLCTQEGVDLEPGVLALVVRAGGGSVRDSLSLLDQLIAGSEIVEGAGSDAVLVRYDRAAALLGFTHGALLNEIIDGFATHDSVAVFGGVDRVIQTGQDPRRFVEDLLERLRDLIVIHSVGDQAKAVMRGIATDELDKMTAQAYRFGLAELTHAAATVNTALTEMSGATSPRLLLELMCAKVLVPASDQTEVGSLARLDRLERRIGVEGGAVASGAAAPAQSTGAAARAASAASPARSIPTQAAPAAAPALAAVTTQKFQAAWEDILNAVQLQSRIVWSVAFALEVIDFTDGVLTRRFGSNADLESFKKQAGAPDTLRNAIRQVLGVEVKFKPLIAEPSGLRAAQVPAAQVTASQAPATTPPISSAAANAAAVAAGITPAAPAQKTINKAAAKPAQKPTVAAENPALTQAAALTEPIETVAAAASPVEAPAPNDPFDDARYGESVVREFGGVPIDDPKTGR
jgi:DNA polymerase-3 subunit gamma/tau